MRRVFVLAATIATVIALISVSVAAAGWGGGFGASNLTFTGSYSGSANNNATFTFTGYGTGTCTNPGDQGPVPGQSGQVAVSASFTSVTIDQYGNITFSGVVLASDACPNSSWISDVVWSYGVATATYTRGGKPVTDTATFTCGPRNAEGHQWCPEDKK